MSEEEPVFMFEGDDPDLQAAAPAARKTFKFFWRELSWERRRIVPAVDLAMIKLPFTNEPARARKGEHMWVDEVDFDGQRLTGVLANSPRWLTSVQAGDQVDVPFAHLEDWLLTSNDVAYGGYTVNAMRSKMSTDERAAHDEAWGLDFGDPSRVRVHRTEEASADGHRDHPMCTNTLKSLREHLQDHPDYATEPDEDGWTALHREALAGNFGSVHILVEHGADPQRNTMHGLNAIELARSLRWEEIATYLESR